MSAGLCDWCGHPMAYLNHTACTPEGEAALETDPGRCPAHGLRAPCQGCAGDHVAGLHVARAHAECPRCETPPAQIEAVSLAAADDSLNSPNERNDR